ncbi:MAG: hypothetical protein ACOC83_09250 [Gemmatimonadota bacterium]
MGADTWWLRVPVLGLGIGAMLLLGSCTNLQMTPHVGGASTNTGTGVQVQYVVRCRACAATYTTEDDTETAEVEGSWSRTVSAGGRSQVSLTVSAGERETHLEGEIWVNDRRVARERVESTSGERESIRLAATVGSGIGGLDVERLPLHASNRLP